MKKILVDSTILKSLAELENSKSVLVDNVKSISNVATKISNAIEAGDYVAVAKCCPTIPKLVWDYLIGPQFTR